MRRRYVKKIISFFMTCFILVYYADIRKIVMATEPQFLAKGVDVSKWNGDIDWRTVAASGIQFAIIRTSFGWSNRIKFTDPKLIYNINGAKSVGIYIGAYHYSYATTPLEAIWEADFFIDRLKWTSWEYPVFMDMEDKCQLRLNTQQRTDIALTFLNRVASQGYYTGIYCSLSWTKNYLDMNRLSKHDLWIAQWNDHCSCTLPYGMWQYTSSGSVPGIVGRVDLDYSYKDYPTYMRTNHLNGF